MLFIAVIVCRNYYKKTGTNTRNEVKWFNNNETSQDEHSQITSKKSWIKSMRTASLIEIKRQPIGGF